ncbi:MAG: L-seryl-tRNA(Sec) selenium transferase [Planctomycetia bacterium]|nr:L-seryl-tRNA(Sec) selenium transferase [Planctomycetia bacterium]
MNPRPPQNQRLLPAVERVLNVAEVVELCRRHGRGVVTGWTRAILDDMRNGRAGELPEDASAIIHNVVRGLGEAARRDASARLRRVINGTGVVIHTNLGRAPLAAAAAQAMAEAASCTNLEVDLVSGRRGRRGAAAEALCREITGAEAALVVNNCAAATFLTLQTLAAGREAIISRGQLVEIGGSYRLPDVFAQAGVVLREVGTTNRTRLSDYEAAIGEHTAALLRVHPSNYRITGFSEEAAIAELVELAHAHRLPAIDDVGSGCLYDLTRFGLPDESIVGNSVRTGADLVLFSGDKLLGGPQCGIVVGRAELVEKLRSNPLARAVRVDKLSLAALETTLEIHRAGRAFAEIPVLRQLSLPADEIRNTAERLVARLRAASPPSVTFSVQAVESAPGGGALAGQTLASWGIAVETAHSERVAEQLRLGTPAVMPRLNEGCVLVDLRTVLPEDEEPLLRRLLECQAH